VDCTVVESNIHPPSDSELLYDCVRVLTRLMCEDVKKLVETVISDSWSFLDLRP
jgi:hypothetical protein